MSILLFGMVGRCLVHNFLMVGGIPQREYAVFCGGERGITQHNIGLTYTRKSVALRYMDVAYSRLSNWTCLQ